MSNSRTGKSYEIAKITKSFGRCDLLTFANSSLFIDTSYGCVNIKTPTVDYSVFKGGINFKMFNMATAITSVRCLLPNEVYNLLKRPNDQLNQSWVCVL